MLHAEVVSAPNHSGAGCVSVDKDECTDQHNVWAEEEEVKSVSAFLLPLPLSLFCPSSYALSPAHLCPSQCIAPLHCQRYGSPQSLTLPRWEKEALRQNRKPRPVESSQV